MISVIATVQLKPNTRDEFLQSFNANVPRVREEDGCIEYFPATDIETGIPIQVTDENSVVVIEKWESLDALKAHLVAPHMKAYQAKVAGFVESVSLRVLQSCH